VFCETYLLVSPITPAFLLARLMSAWMNLHAFTPKNIVHASQAIGLQNHPHAG
jgi:hypothetical protein